MCPWPFWLKVQAAFARSIARNYLAHAMFTWFRSTKVPAPSPAKGAPAPAPAKGAPAPSQAQDAPPSEPGAPAPAAWEPSRELFAECPSSNRFTMSPVPAKAHPPCVLPMTGRGRSSSPKSRDRSSSPPSHDPPQDGRGRPGDESTFRDPEPPWKVPPVTQVGEPPLKKPPPKGGKIHVPYKHPPPRKFEDIPSWCHYEDATGEPGCWNENDWVRFVNNNLSWFSYKHCNGYEDLEWWFVCIRQLQNRPVPPGIILPRFEINCIPKPGGEGGGGGGEGGEGG